MSHAHLVEIALSELDARGIPRWHSAPAGLEFLWNLGIPLRPIHYMRFPTLVALIALCGFSVLVIFKTLFFATAVMTDNQWYRYYEHGLLLSFFLQSSLVSGVASFVVALCFALYYRWQVWGTHLPSWDDLAKRSAGSDMEGWRDGY